MVLVVAAGEQTREQKLGRGQSDARGERCVLHVALDRRTTIAKRDAPEGGIKTFTELRIRRSPSYSTHNGHGAASAPARSA
jgi:hypothetical protein